MAEADPDQFRMNLGDHLGELRTRLIRGLAGPLVGTAILLPFGEAILKFLAQPLYHVMEAAGQPPTLQTLNPYEAFTTWLKLVVIGGLIIGLPWLVWQLWRFIAPGLYTHEKRFVNLLMPGSAVLTAAGLAFMYYLMLPVALAFLTWFAANLDMPSTEGSTLQNFLVNVAGSHSGEGSEKSAVDGGKRSGELGQLPIRKEPPKSDTLEPGDAWIDATTAGLVVYIGSSDGERKFLRFEGSVTGRKASRPQKSGGLVSVRNRLSEYISFVLMMGLAFAVAFQLPLVMLLLASMGIFDLNQLKSARKYAFLGAFIVGALLTPADPISMFLLAVPIYALWELGLLVVRWFVGQPTAA